MIKFKIKWSSLVFYSCLKYDDGIQKPSFNGNMDTIGQKNKIKYDSEYTEKKHFVLYEQKSCKPK